jgi:hypothetical protein
MFETMLAGMVTSIVTMVNLACSIIKGQLKCRLLPEGFRRSTLTHVAAAQAVLSKAQANLPDFMRHGTCFYVSPR